MTEKQSDNEEKIEESVSKQGNNNEDTPVNHDQTMEDKELSNESNEKINADDLKDTITNNDARLEQLERKSMKP